MRIFLTYFGGSYETFYNTCSIKGWQAIEKDLCQAIEQDDVELVDDYLDAGEPVNFDESLLLRPSDLYRWAVADLLIAHGATYPEACCGFIIKQT